MQKTDINEILSLINNKDKGLGYILEIYHALIEFIKSGNAIRDMGHPDFYFGATCYKDYHYSSYPPSLTIFQLAKAFSDCLKKYDTSYVWFRDLSTWEDFCKFIIELHQIRYFYRNHLWPIKSYKYYLRKTECPACGTKRINYRFDLKFKVNVKEIDKSIYIECRSCGNYILTRNAIKYLDSFEKKAKLYVYLSTRVKNKNIFGPKITPKMLKEMI